jgi:uncharacterized membrane protein YebE (DUF533 family)
MDNIVALFGITIPIVAIAGAFAYAAYEKWQEGQEKKQALEATSGGHEAQTRIRRIEDEMTMMRAELGDDMRDVKERLMMIERLLQDVG